MLVFDISQTAKFDTFPDFRLEDAKRHGIKNMYIFHKILEFRQIKRDNIHR